jgi:hypothetical protein
MNVRNGMQIYKNKLNRSFGFRKMAENNVSSYATPNSASPRSHIAAIIPRGEVIRNFLYTDCMDLIAAEQNLSLLSVSLFTELDISLREKYRNVFTLTEVDETCIVRYQREILDIAHGRWLWSRAAQERWRLRDTEAVSVKQKIKRFGKKFISRPFANNSGLKFLSRAERASSRILDSANRYTDIYKNIKPDLVFNGSHIHSRNAIQAVQAAQWLGIPTATFIFSWDNLTSQGRIILPYDYFLVWNELLKNQLLEMYDWIKPENVFVTGTPQFDFHFRPEFYVSRKEFCSQIGADPNRPIVFYATGMPNHMPGEPAIVEDIADALIEYPASERPQLLVRVYAKDRTGRFDELRFRRPEILFPEVAWEPQWLTPKYEDSYALVNTLRHCAVGINVASTVSLELCMFDKPVINVGYNPPEVENSVLSYSDYYAFDHYKPVVDSGAVRVAKSKAEMRVLLEESLSNPGAGSSDRKHLIEKMFGNTLDGKSANRVAEVLTNLAGSQN